MVPQCVQVLFLVIGDFTLHRHLPFHQTSLLTPTLLHLPRTLRVLLLSPKLPLQSQTPLTTPVIKQHSLHQNNPIYLSNLMRTRCPQVKVPRNYFFTKNIYTTLAFPTLIDLQLILSTTFGTHAVYEGYQTMKTQTQPKSTPLQPLNSRHP